MYQEMGFATFELNSFQSRNITSTVGSQVEITTATMILDAYRALEKLSNDPRIDKNRVSIIGWSLGGAVSLFSGWLPLKNAITKKVSFASHLAFYPPCFIDPENLVNFTRYSVPPTSLSMLSFSKKFLSVIGLAIIPLLFKFSITS